MIVGIHQPHYFPWLGYLDKIAKSDCFVVLDQVQFEKGSQMIRNRVLDNNGEIKYLTVSADTKGFLEKEYREIIVKDRDRWIGDHWSALRNYYRKAPYREEVLALLEGFFQNRFETLFEWTFESVKLLCGVLGIETPLLLQSDVEYDRSGRKSGLVLEICQALSADTYLSGRGGSVKYLDLDEFRRNGIEVRFQDFQHPVYPQCQSAEFVPGLSSLDALFNCGLRGTRDLFRKNLNNEGS